MRNGNLGQAKANKNDEFYTMYGDIEKEISKYPSDFFRGKIVYSNCDDPYVSGFADYFFKNFFRLKIKKYIVTGINPTGKAGYKLVVTKDNFYSRYGDISMIEDGSFDSDECVGLLKEADVVVTNPPFSKFREYFSLLTKYSKDFLILGNINGVTYKEVFPSIKSNRVRIGYTKPTMFMSPFTEKMVKLGMVDWFTTLNVLNGNIKLTKHYSEEQYPKYNNFDAIEVKRVKDIPCDYDGIMGVPNSFIEVYNPQQFELVSVGKGKFMEGFPIGESFVNMYRSQGGTAHISANMLGLTLIKDGRATLPYDRILIRNRNPVKI